MQQAGIDLKFDIDLLSVYVFNIKIKEDILMITNMINNAVIEKGYSESHMLDIKGDNPSFPGHEFSTFIDLSVEGSSFTRSPGGQYVTVDDGKGGQYHLRFKDDKSFDTALKDLSESLPPSAKPYRKSFDTLFPS